jgi:hemerythrin-like domain-containing protein
MGCVAAEERDYLASLENDHRLADQAGAELAAAVDQLKGFGPKPEVVERYRAAARALRAIYTAHIASEDQVLTALARRALNPGALAEIAAEMKQRRQR